MAGAILSLLILGFVVFASIVTASRLPTTRAPDGIAVLTGGGHRLAEGARLLAEGCGRRLLISGVNRMTGRDDWCRREAA